MKIGELAKQTGLRVSTLRYYEQIGLLPVSERSDSGYRLFSEDSVQRVEFIARAKMVGFSLQEIRSVLVLYDRGESPCELSSRLAQRKLRKIEKILTRWELRKDALQSALEDWQNGTSQPSPICSILNVSIQHNNRRNLSMSRTIEVFTAGCPLCQETVQRVREAVAPCGCRVVERTADSAEAQIYGVSAVPAIYVNGQHIFTGRPTQEQATALLRQGD